MEERVRGREEGGEREREGERGRERERERDGGDRDVLGWHFTRAGCCGDRITATPAVTSHEASQIPHDCSVTIIRLLQAMLLLVISNLPNLLTAWYSPLYSPSNHYDINANVFENLIKHFMRGHELMLCYISIGYAIAGENRVKASIKKRRIPSALGLLYLFLNFPNIKHIAYIYTRSRAYLAGMKTNHEEKCPPFAI
jgi:hypothetical protein